VSDHVALLAAALSALAPVADQLPDTRWRDADIGDRLTVRPWTVAAACPAALALDGPQDFEASPATMGPAVAAAVVDRLVLGDPDPRRPARPTSPAEAYRAVLADPPPDEWPWDAVTEPGARPLRAALAAEVHRRAGALARMLPDWPPPVATRAGRLPAWIHPERPLRLAGGVDLVLGRRDGGHTLVVVAGGDHRATTRRRLAYEAIVEALALRRPPARVLGLLPASGRRWELAVDEALLTEGIAAAALGARIAFGATTATAGDLPRDPGPHCRECTHRAGCGPGTAWTIGAGRLRSGFLSPR
jgi:hypothetical protein